VSEITFPKLSAAPDTTGVIVSWFVASGDPVTPQTLVAEVAVDKVDAEIYPDSGGTITILAEEAAEVAQGTVIATVN
jgi:pyruvate/2-oxoglutarate dehydrogenase complex dihydrolipoamide acyltransferase (E2) component